jgi:DNA processing protein
MLSSVASFTTQEGKARAVRVEVDVHRGLPSFAIVGMPDAPARSERERLRAALINCGFEYPMRRITVNLAPVSLRKAGPGMGLAIAAALLCSSAQLEPGRFERLALVGELGLAGELKPVAGVPAITVAARDQGLEGIVVPAGQGVEACFARGIEVYEVEHLGELAALASGELRAPEKSPEPPPQAAAPAWRPHACAECQRRGHLLAALAPYIERVCSSSAGRAAREMLGLSNRALAEAVAHEKAAEVLAGVEALSPARLALNLANAGCWALCRCEEGFPASLREAPEGPWAIFGRGDPAHLRGLDPAGAITLVGARRTTSYGREVARELGREFAAAGLLVISGLAFGVDACAHRGALEAGRTLAVLASGPDTPYPAAHRALFGQVCESGAVISEMPPGTGPWRWSFPARNRIAAALGGTTVVVEAAERSGSLITAQMARKLGRELGAVPGPITSRVSAGPNQLLVEGARVIRSAEDLPAARVRKGA